MPKPVEKAAPRKPASKKHPSSDPNRRAHQMLDAHLGKLDEGKWATPQPDTTSPHGDPFEEQFKARMAELGRKGGKIGGKRRLETMTGEQRAAAASKAARTRWARK